MKNLQDLMLTGRVAKLRNGNKYLIIRDVYSEVYGHQKWVLVRHNGFMAGGNYDKTLLFKQGNPSYDIIEIYQKSKYNKANLSSSFLDIESKTFSVWKRGSFKAIKGLYFGDSNPKTWIVSDDDELSKGDLCEVETVEGRKIVEVQDIFYTDDEDYEKVLRKINI